MIIFLRAFERGLTERSKISVPCRRIKKHHYIGGGSFEKTGKNTQLLARSAGRHRENVRCASRADKFHGVRSSCCRCCTEGYDYLSHVPRAVGRLRCHSRETDVLCGSVGGSTDCRSEVIDQC